MTTVIQRVKKAHVTVENEVKGKIEKGLVVFLGVAEGDTEKEMSAVASKIANLRIFEDENQKMNFSMLDMGADALVISNFTLCGDCSHGRRPFFGGAAKPDEALDLFEKFKVELTQLGVNKVESGVFGADMDVMVENDGPITIIINSSDLKI